MTSMSEETFDYDEYIGDNIMKTSVGNFGTDDLVMFFLNLKTSVPTTSSCSS